jgi:hypothetical protein
MTPTSTGTPATGGSLGRARRSFWGLVAVAVLAAGWLNAALTAPPGPVTGLHVASSGTVLIFAVGLAARVLVAVERARRRSDQESTSKE